MEDQQHPDVRRKQRCESDNHHSRVEAGGEGGREAGRKDEEKERRSSVLQVKLVELVAAAGWVRALGVGAEALENDSGGLKFIVQT